MVLRRNSIPIREIGISAISSPREIITCTKMDFKKHSQLNFGKYVEVHDGPTHKEGIKTCTLICGALGPTGNLQCTYKLTNNKIGTKPKKRSKTCIPIPDAVNIERSAKYYHKKTKLYWKHIRA